MGFNSGFKGLKRS